MDGEPVALSKAVLAPRVAGSQVQRRIGGNHAAASNRGAIRVWLLENPAHATVRCVRIVQELNASSRPADR
jgi:hypothetical protein